MKEKIMHIVKGGAAFAAIYFLAAGIVEVILIVGLTVLGYDALHGQMPDSYWTGLFPLYGFAAFALLCLLFNRVIRKKKLSDIMLRFQVKTLWELAGSMAAGALAIGLIMVFLTVVGAYRFMGASSMQAHILLATFGAYLIQGISEEIMCRGLFQNFFAEKLSLPAAILLSALLFTAPHVPTIADYALPVVLISLINLLLVSILFSLSMVGFQSVWVPAGLHVGWNFTLSCVCGLELSGMEGGDGLLRFFVTPSADWLHGGAYGIEAGVAVTVLLIVCDLLLYKFVKGKNHGKLR